MIIKPSISWLTKDNDSLLINDVSVVLLGLANNISIYATPSPTLEVIQAALDDFSGGVAATADGGKSATAKKNNLRLILIGLMRQLANYVASACKGDMTNLLLSGFPPQKSVRTPIGILPAPQNPSLAHGLRSGDLAGKVNPVFGAASYTWRLIPGTSGATPIIAQSTAANYMFTGLIPGTNYSLTVNAVGAAGPGGWSNAVSLFAD